MLINPAAFAIAVVPHAKSANKKFLGQKNWPTLAKSEVSRVREYIYVRIGFRLQRRLDGHGRSQGQAALSPPGWMLSSPFFDRQALFFLARCHAIYEPLAKLDCTVRYAYKRVNASR